MARRTHIVIAEPSQIVRSGLLVLLRRFTALSADVAELWDLSGLGRELACSRPDVLLINPALAGAWTPARLRTEAGLPELRVVAVLHTQLPASQLLEYDDSISLFDTAEQIREKLVRAAESERPGDPSASGRQELTAREREIVVCVVKGLTNRQIAEKLFLSAHTVMTHRKNIAAKLQIHSPAGLTIYAIVNRLVDIDEVREG